MNVQFMEPLNRAWKRMTVALFKPFDLHKWLVIGFNAFLAGLLDTQRRIGRIRGSRRAGTSGISFTSPGRPGIGSRAIRAGPSPSFSAFSSPSPSSSPSPGSARAASSCSSRASCTTASRSPGRGGITRRRAIRSSSGGSSSALASFVVFGGLIAWFFVRGAALYDSGADPVLPVGLIVGTGLLTLAVVLVWGYIALFLREFVSALMFKHRISAGEAWTRFLALFRSQPWPFIGFGIITFLLVLVFAVAVVFAVIGTCCIGALFLVIPYISTVVTLPVWYAYRAFSLEFLAQFGPEYDVFPRPAAPVPAPPVPAV